MKFRYCPVVIALATICLLPELGAAELKRPEINPALLYWQAAAALPKLTDEQAQTLREIAAGKRTVDPQKVDAKSFENAETILRKAAASTAPCEWGLQIEDGPAMTVPHLAKLRELATLALFEAEVKLAQGNTAEGMEWLLTAHRVGRHSGAGENLISFLVQSAIEQTALRAAARHCREWDAATRASYAAALKALPPLHSLPECYLGELSVVDWLEAQLSVDGPQKVERIKSLLAVVSDSTASPDGSTVPPGPFNSAAELKALGEWRTFQKRTIEALGKPWQDGRPELEAIQREVDRNESSLMKAGYPVIHSVYEKSFIIATLRTMLDTALRYGAQIDEVSAATSQDALDGKPLRLKKADDGSLSLVSAEQHPKSKAIELILGRQAP